MLIKYLECVTLLAPLLFSTKDVHMGVSCINNNKGEWITSVAPAALDVLIKACEKVKPLDIEVNLNCHYRKLQIRMIEAGIELSPASQNSALKMSGINSVTVLEESKESSNNQWNHLVAEEVKAISSRRSHIKNFIIHGNSQVAMRIVGGIQSLLLAIMCNIVNIYFSRRSSGIGVSEQNEQKQKGYFVEAAFAFFKLQQLIPKIPVKTIVIKSSPSRRLVYD